MYMEDIERFRGTGERNEKGETLEEFLENYDARKYDLPANTTDIVVVHKGRVLLIKRKNHPCIGMWSTPGGFVNFKEDLLDCAKRELYEETGVTGIPLKQMLTWGRPDLDPRWRIITTPFYADIDDDVPVKAGDDAKDAAWFDYDIEGNGSIRTMTLTNDQGDVLKTVIETKEDGYYYPIESSGIDGAHACIVLEALDEIKKG